MSKLTHPLVIYHGGCYDGFTAAWIIHTALHGDCDLYEGVYGEPMPDVTGRDVVIVDFSYPREEMVRAERASASLLVLDHHKTAQAQCEGLAFCRFDMKKSGCRLAWEEFVAEEFVGEEFMGEALLPDWIRRVEDRDLWRWAYSDTAEVHAYIASQPMTLAAWTKIHAMPLSRIVDGGRSIRRYIQTWCDKAANEARMEQLAGHAVVAVNVPYQNASEMGTVLLQRFPDAVCAVGYFRRADGRWQYSLRSRSTFDVSTIATQYGGGGHAGAAGFDTAECLFLECRIGEGEGIADGVNG